jgi:NTE family protein
MFWKSNDRFPQGGAAADRLRPPLALGLQGGGAHGAFAWGVLDRLLEDDTFVPAAISGASAGAINAVLTAWGFLQGGQPAARAALDRFWTTVGQMSLLSPLGLPGAGLHFDLMTRVVSPYQFNPLNLNPLRDLLAATIDFEQLQRDGQLQLFLSATDVTSGDQRIFREWEVSVDVLMASSCIPYVHQAVEIDGESYWDGGFSSNPPVLPLVMETECRSLLLIKLTPDAEPVLPTAAPDIFARLKRVLFNAPLMRELDALEEIQHLLRRSNLLPADLKRLRDMAVEAVVIDHRFFGNSPGAALDPRPDLLSRLHAAGRQAAEALLSASDAAPNLS